MLICELSDFVMFCFVCVLQNNGGHQGSDDSDEEVHDQ